MSVQESVHAGNLADAIAKANLDVKHHPSQPELRLVLAELMCFSGNLERAANLMESAIKLNSSGAAPGLYLMQHLVHGEIARQNWYKSGFAPNTRSVPSAELTSALKTIVEFRAGDRAAAATLVAAANSQRNFLVTFNSQQSQNINEFRDLNDLCCSVMELISATGQFFWVPWGEIDSLHFMPVKTLRDILWRPVQCQFQDGSSERYFMPSLYAGSATANSEAVRLGQATDWNDLGNGLTAGLGLRMFLAGDATPTILEIDEIRQVRTEAGHVHES